MEYYCEIFPQCTLRTITGDVLQQQQWGQVLIGGRLQGIKDEAGQLSELAVQSEEKTANKRDVWMVKDYGSWRELFFIDFPKKSRTQWYRYATVLELRSFLWKRFEEGKIYGSRIAILPLTWRHSEVIAAATIAAISSFLDLTLSSSEVMRAAKRSGHTQFELHDFESTAAFDNVLTNSANLREYMESVHVVPPQWFWKPSTAG